MLTPPDKIPWKAEFHKTMFRQDGTTCDMWTLVWMDNPELLVSIAVPHKRDDIVHFIVERCKTQ
jgi:hypothetical protein